MFKGVGFVSGSSSTDVIQSGDCTYATSVDKGTSRGRIKIC